MKFISMRFAVLQQVSFNNLKSYNLSMYTLNIPQSNIPSYLLSIWTTGFLSVNQFLNGTIFFAFVLAPLM